MFRWRKDGDRVKDLSKTRMIMPLIMRGRNESAVYFEQKIDFAPITAFLLEAREKSGDHITFLHAFLWAVGRSLHENPRLNRFVAGGRIYQRRGIWLSYSAKREKKRGSPILPLKDQFDPEIGLLEFSKQIQDHVSGDRSAEKNPTEKELGLFFLLPHVILSAFAWLVMRLDNWGLLPQFFIAGDPLFSSIFVANLGSVHMDGAHHHLYEYGNSPFFAVIGRAQEEAVVVDGEVVVKKLVTIRYTFDERIEDGLYCLGALDRLRDILENPDNIDL